MAQRTFTDRYASGLKASVHNNSIAYAFSIMITAALAVVSAGRDTPGIWEVLTFAGGAVLSFTVVEVFVYFALRHRLEEESTEVRLLGSIFSFLSIGLALGATWIVERFLGGLIAWPVGGFVAATVFVLVLGLELSVAERLRGHK
jgi:hypothetical protein